VCFLFARSRWRAVQQWSRRGGRHMPVMRRITGCALHNVVAFLTAAWGVARQGFRATNHPVSWKAVSWYAQYSWEPLCLHQGFSSRFSVAESIVLITGFFATYGNGVALAVTKYNHYRLPGYAGMLIIVLYILVLVIS